MDDFPGVEKLSPRELQVIRLMVMSCLGRKQIARELGVSPGTINTHLENIYEKLGIPDESAGERRQLMLARLIYRGQAPRPSEEMADMEWLKRAFMEWCKKDFK